MSKLRELKAGIPNRTPHKIVFHACF